MKDLIVFYFSGITSYTKTASCATAGNHALYKIPAYHWIAWPDQEKGVIFFGADAQPKTLKIPSGFFRADARTENPKNAAIFFLR